VSNELTEARAALLDAIQALEAHIDALVLVGAQAIYLHTGKAQVELAEYTTDGDLVVDPELLGVSPLIEEALAAARFTRVFNAIGTWRSPRNVPVDLMVPAAVAAGTGRRSVQIPPHDSNSVRRTRGLEAALVDNSRMSIAALDPADSRIFEISVAGPAALLVAKLHKISDRIPNPSRLDNKDAHDVYRILAAIETRALANSIGRLLVSDLSAAVTAEGIDLLGELFVAGPGAVGSAMAGAAEEVLGDPASVAEAVSLLAKDLYATLRV